MPILTLKLVAMAMSLETSEKGGQIGNLRSNTFGENLMKIGPVDTGIALLKCLFKKVRKRN